MEKVLVTWTRLIVDLFLTPLYAILVHDQMIKQSSTYVRSREGQSHKDSSQRQFPCMQTISVLWRIISDDDSNVNM